MNCCIYRKYQNFKKAKNRKKLYKEIQVSYLKNGKIEVLRGPFKGMIYPDFISTGSALYPKLSGIYEKEIQHIFDNIMQKKYKYIYDIGCAEGYYAIGLKRAIPEAEVYAFDIDLYAQKLCQDMAKANNVEVYIEGECTSQRLEITNWGELSLIISDCEGAERDLFTEKTAKNLQNCELLIEVHDWLQYESSTLDKLIDIFKETHEYTLTYGIDDYEKVYRYTVEEFGILPLEEKFLIMAEHRRRLGEWLYFSPKICGRTLKQYHEI